MPDDVLLAKADIIERCLKRIEEEYANIQDSLEKDQTRQDAIVLNLQRACEACIDMGLRVVRLKRLGLPHSNREIFALLERANLIDEKLSNALQSMVGFRNIAIHEYQKLNIAILEHILNHNLEDIIHFQKLMLKIE